MILAGSAAEEGQFLFVLIMRCKNAQAKGIFGVHQRIAVPLRSDIHRYHVLPPEMAHLEPINGHGVDLAFILHGHYAPFIGNGLKNIK